YGTLQIGSGFDASEIAFTNEGKDKGFVGSDDHADGDESFYIYNDSTDNYAFTIDINDTTTLNGETVFEDAANVSFAPQTVTTTSATLTLTPTSSYVNLRCNRSSNQN